MMERLKERRKLIGYSKQEVADKLNISLSRYSKYESGDKEPLLAELAILAILFDTSTDYLLERTDTPIPHKRSWEKD